MEAYELALRKAIREHEAELANMRRALSIHEAVLADLELARQAKLPPKRKPRVARVVKAERAAQSREAPPPKAS